MKKNKSERKNLTKSSSRKETSKRYDSDKEDLKKNNSEMKKYAKCNSGKDTSGKGQH